MKNLLRKLLRNLNGTALNREILENNHRLETRDLNEILAMQHLTPLKMDSFIVNTGWSASYSMIHHIINDLIVNKRVNILEFGMGNSSVYIAQAIKRLKLDSKLFSVDANVEWIDIFKTQLIELELEQYCNIFYAPIERNNIGLWYSEDSLKKLLPEEHKFDVIIIDGPPGSVSKNVRQNGLDYIFSRISNDFIIFIDDTLRADESQIIALISQRFPQIKVLRFDRYAIVSNNNAADAVPSYLWK